MIKMQKMAPLPSEERARLKADVKDLRATALRKQITIDRHEMVNESRAAKDHFELGCWLYRFTTLQYGKDPNYLQERVNVILRLFLANIMNPSYDFFTVFNFGERQFDSIFEQGDSHAVIDHLRTYLSKDSTGQVAKGFEYFGWPKVADASRMETKAASDEPQTQGQLMLERANPSQ